MRKINRKKIVEGTKIPGFIHNFNFHYINVDVYEDGMTNCWELVDFKKLKNKIDIGWLVPKVPKNKSLSIFELGHYKVKSSKWKYNKKSYYELIEKVVKELNPEFTNIYEISKYEEELNEKRRIYKSPKSADYYVKNEFGYKTIEGEGFNIFLKEDNKNYLVDLVVYKDGKIMCYNGNEEKEYSIDSIKNEFFNGTFFTEFKNDMEICINELGDTILSEEFTSTNIDEKYKQFLDMYNRLNGEQGALEKCRKAYCDYLIYPSEVSKERLKKLYEQVPEHERMYLGDMDSKDSDFRRIIYTNKKREV